MIARFISKAILARSLAAVKVCLFLGVAFAQQASESNATGTASSATATPGTTVEPAEKTKEQLDKRILGVLPNYRTANPLDVYQPLTTGQKFSIALKDSFDWPNYLVSAAFAGIYQLEDSNPSFGQGVRGYAHRYWTAYIDQSMGNLMTEAVMPTILHEDPRYFRKVAGSKKSRTAYALTRVLVTRTDTGGTRFNYSEVIGNGIMATLGNAYYPDSRGVSDTVQRFGLQLATDSLSNLLKEFWPDVKRHFKHSSGD